MTPPDWLPLLPTTATVGSVIAAGFYAAYTIRHNREIARMRATLDLIEKAESSEFYRELIRVFRRALAQKDVTKRVPVDQLLNPQTPEEVDQRLKILFFLNHYELIAAGFRNGVLDSSFYADYMRGAAVHDWTVVKEFVYRMREPEPGGHPHPNTIYEHFETLADEWAWETRHEGKLRAQGKSEAQIRRAIAVFRANPKMTRPPA